RWTLVGLAGLGALGGLLAGCGHGAAAAPPASSTGRTVPGGDASSVKSTGARATETYARITRVDAEHAPAPRLPNLHPPRHARPVAIPTVPQVREQVQRLEFPPMNPFVASVVSDVWAGQQGEVRDRIVWLSMPEHFNDTSLRVGTGFQ